MSYSHPATKQDMWVLENSLNCGTFLELGAYNGVKHSNTLLLERLGWSGMLVEGLPEHYHQCLRNRPNSVVKNVWVGNGERELVFVGGQYTGVKRTMPLEFLKEHARRGNEGLHVQTVPIEKVTQQRRYDYFSLDTEGGEDEILERFFDTGHTCRLLTVEFRYDMLFLRRLEKLCEINNMYLDQIRGFDACFKRNQ